MLAALTLCWPAPLLNIPDWRFDAWLSARPPVILIAPLVEMVCTSAGAVVAAIVAETPLVSGPVTLIEPACAPAPAVMVWRAAPTVEEPSAPVLPTMTAFCPLPVIDNVCVPLLALIEALLFSPAPFTLM